jgi:hypothetical protein
MKNSTLSLIFIISLLFFSNSGVAQDLKTDLVEPKMYNNSLNISVGPGGIFIFYLPAAVYYERMFQGELFGPKIASIFDAGLGVETHWGGGGRFYMGRYGVLVGAKKHHLEVKAGLVYFTGDLQGLNPSFSVGYRSQKRLSHFIFRTGIGWPEAIYVGWGVSF